MAELENDLSKKLLENTTKEPWREYRSTPATPELNILGLEFPPKNVGYYSLSNNKSLCLFMQKKPNIIKRFMMKYLLGFTWSDLSDINNINIK